MTGRTMIVGDVHGMTDALQALLARLRPAAGDTLVFVGDLVNKGPDSLGTLRLVRALAEDGPCDTVVVEGNHEDLHRRYRRNLVARPAIAAEQANRMPILAALTRAMSTADIAFLESAVPFHRLPRAGLLVVHGGIPGTMQTLPETPEDLARLPGGARRAFDRLLRTRHVSADTGAFVTLGQETDADPFWAEVYDGRFGHVVFGHTPFLDGPRHYPHATAIDTGAVKGGALTALVVDPAGRRSFEAVSCPVAHA